MIGVSSWNFILNNKQIIKTTLRLMSTSCKQEVKELTPAAKGVPNKMRADPAVKKIDTPEFRSIFTKELNSFVGLFQKYNYELRIAGGAVRDILMHIEPKDIDFATTATPDQMKEMFTKENVRMINPKGEKHGTVTVRINNKENFEVTTLRVDVRSDGRYALVKFTTDWQLDANRRDLTINSMFLGFDGTLYDYFYGYEDLQKRRVVFVGDATVRVQEDFLRILRYFRFFGRIACDGKQHDKSVLEAIEKNANGLARISGERIWSEVQKIVVGNFVEEIVLQMIDCGLAPYCGLPEVPNLEEFKRLILDLQNFEKPHYPILIIISLLNNIDDAIKLHERVKLSAHDRDLAFFIIQQREKVDVDHKTLNHYQIMCLEPYAKREYVEELLKYCNKKELYNELKSWSLPKFPISGKLLMERGCPVNNKMGFIINQLKLIWAKSNFMITADELLDEHLPVVMKRVSSPVLSPKKKIKM